MTANLESRGSVPRRVLTRLLVIVGVAALLALPLAPGRPTGTFGAPTGPTSALGALPRPTSVGPPEGPKQPITCPSSGDPCYLQEGAQLNDFDGAADPASLVLTSLWENFTVVANGNDVRPAGGSGLATAYELNGVTTRGDWVQMAVGDNWPWTAPCNVPVFTLFYEIWNSVGVSVTESRVGTNIFGCDQPFVPNVGDTMTLGMSLVCAGQPAGTLCLTYTDVTQAVSATVDLTLPDSSALGFVTTAVFNGAHGYFIGPATETTWSGDGGCPTIVLPTVNYTVTAYGYDNASGWLGALDVSNFSAWGDEFNTSTTNGTQLPNAFCYGDSAAFLLSSSPVTTFFDPAGSNPLGPHWISGQNWSATEAILGTAVQTPGLTRFQTDPPVPSDELTTLIVGAGDLDGLAAVDSGQTYLVQGSAISSGPGFLPLLQCSWTIDGTPYTYPSCVWSGTGISTGIFTIASYDVFTNAEVEASEGAQLWVLSDPSSYLILHPNTDVEPAEQDVTPINVFTEEAGGGDPPYAYTWNGFPSAWGCHYAVPTFNCIPTTSGTFSVSVSVTDALGYEYTSQPLTVRVYDPCTRFCYRIVLHGDPPPGLDWGANLYLDCELCGGYEPLTPSNSTSPPYYNYSVPNGTYTYLLTGPSGERVLAPPVGNLTVNGSNLSLTVGFGPKVRSAVGLSIKGLLPGDSACFWLVTGHCFTASNRSGGGNGKLSIAGITPGTYPYWATPVAGLNETVLLGGEPANASGWLTVGTHGATVDLDFRSSTFGVTFQETGLPPARSWTVRVTGDFDGKYRTISRSSRTTAITLDLPNGSFAVALRTAKGYLGIGPNGIYVGGIGFNVSVQFVVERRAAPAADAAVVGDPTAIDRAQGPVGFVAFLGPGTLLFGVVPLTVALLGRQRPHR